MHRRFQDRESIFRNGVILSRGESYAYLVGGPIETNYALDKALKAGNTRVARYWYPPSHANSSGAVLAGTVKSACRAATTAFIEALEYAIKNPLEI